MQQLKMPNWQMGFVFLVSGMLFLSFEGVSQDKIQLSAGGYHGELDFPWSWKRYYSYDQWTGMMRDMALKYPKLASVESI